MNDATSESVRCCVESTAAAEIDVKARALARLTNASAAPARSLRTWRVSRRLLPPGRVAVAVALVAVTVTVFAIGEVYRPAPQQPKPAPGLAMAPGVGFLSVPIGGGHDLTVWSWSGKRAASIHTGPELGCCDYPLYLSPDGRLVLIPSPRGGAGSVVDLSGKVVGHVSIALKVMWSSSSDSLCAIQDLPSSQPGVGDGNLVVEDLNSGSRIVTRLQVLADHYEVFLARCDVLGGEAVLFGDFEGETRNATEINLHSGATTTPSWPRLQAVAISRNGQYVAYVNGEVRDTETGAIVARLRGQPEAISWLGHVVVQLVGTDGIEAIDWQTGRVIWHRTGAAKCPCQGLSVFTSSRPFSDDMALNVQGGIAAQQGLWLVSLAHGPLRLAARVEAGII